LVTLDDYKDVDLILAALQNAVFNNARNKIKYAEGTLINWRKEMIPTYQQLQAKEEREKNNKRQQSNQSYQKPKPKRKLIASGELRPTTQPDLDNLIKGIKDGCNKIIWHDDSQIVDMTVRKFYSEQPRAEVTIEWVEK